MASAETFLTAVNEALFSRLRHLPWQAHVEDFPHYESFLNPILPFLQGGKRSRARLVYAGFLCANGESHSDETYHAALHVACAVELFHASALAHDDVIDESDERRGNPAPHIIFAREHHSRSLLGSAKKFGVASAILLGDFLYALAQEEIEEAVRFLSPQAASHLRSAFLSMCAEVIFGQFIDIYAEHEPWEKSDISGRDLAELVISHKTISYSVAAPLLLGAHCGGASSALLRDLSSFAHPLGMAYQLRDDALGIFGDPALTGKPACGDITEGKRTVLLCLARERMNPEQRLWIEQLIGEDLDDDTVATLRQLLRDLGAYRAHEDLIDDYEKKASAFLDTLTSASPAGKTALEAILTSFVARRS